MIKVRIITVAALLAFIFSPAVVMASEIDILVEKLVSKGVLSHGEAQQILTETKEEVRRQVVAGENESLPKWVQTFKLKGDLRTRYQWEEKKAYPTGSATSVDKRERFRVRLRLGAEAKVNDDMAVALGLATGSSDPRSTNQTMQDSFSTKAINLDYAYATWTPIDWAAVHLGKIKGKETLWMVSDLLWDGDVNPEGGAVALTREVSEDIKLFANAGWLIIDEVDGSPSGADPSMSFFQPGIEWSLPAGMKFKGSVNSYFFADVEGRNTILDNNAGTNSRTNGAYDYDYDAVGASVELSAKEPFGGLVNYLAVFGDYINNPDAVKDTGWLLGFKFGDKKVKKFDQWQFKYQYRDLEKDAWIDFLPDSDVMGGDTGVKSHEVIFQYGLGNNCTLGLDYYNTEADEIASGYDKATEEQVMQCDIVWKF